MTAPLSRRPRLPASATVLILFSDGGSDFLCSGFMISADTVATAGHCVAPGDGSGFYGRTPTGSSRPRRPPIAITAYAAARRLYSVSGWLNDGRDDFDYGAIKLNARVGDTTGWYGFTRSMAVSTTPVRVQGYPGDKPRRSGCPPVGSPPRIRAGSITVPTPPAA